MDFEFTDSAKDLQDRVKAFMDKHLYPVEKEVRHFHEQHENLWKEYPKMEEWKQLAKDAGLWNLFLAKEYGDH